MHNRIFGVSNAEINYNQSNRSWATGKHRNGTQKKEEIIIAKLRTGHIKLTHDPLKDHGTAPNCKACVEHTPLTVKYILESKHV